MVVTIFFVSAFVLAVVFVAATVARSWGRVTAIRKLTTTRIVLLDYFRLADYPEVGQTSQYKRVSRY